MPKSPFPSIDKENMYSVLKGFPNQIMDAYKLGDDISVKGFDRILVAGMGGSALPGEFLKSFMAGSKVPVEVNKDYTIPSYVRRDTLVFAVSYSGNTEETVSSLGDALAKKAKVVVITSGGKLKKISEKKRIPIVLVPSGLQPRIAYGYLFFSMLKILENSNAIPSQKNEVNSLVKMVSDTSYESNGRRIARKLKGKIPIIYSSDKLRIASYKWKINFNENTKILAFSNVLPEMNHNEINGFGGAKGGQFFAIILKDKDDHIRVRKRMDITKVIIKKAGVGFEEINSNGKGLLSRLFSLIVLGDWTSYYLCMEYKRDPTPVPVIEGLKKQLK